MGHPFSTRKGRTARDRIAANLYAAQLGKCRMCKTTLPPSLRGKAASNAPVLDHIRPYRLRPDLTWSQDNMQLICRACHADCETIEAEFASDPDMIAQVKARRSEAWLT